MTQIGGRVGERDKATLQARAFGYLVDSVVLAGMLLVFFVFAGFVFLLGSDFGNSSDPADAYWYTLVALPFAAVPAWTALNLGLLCWRGQTIGQYVAGVAVVRADGGRVGVGDCLKLWFALNPLFFHPLLAIPLAVLTLVASAGTVGIVGSGSDKPIMVFALGVGFLCLAAPLVALATLAVSRKRRSMYERLSGTRMVAVAQD